MCRYAYRKGANRVLGIDIDDSALSRGRGINRLYGYRSVTLTKGDVRNLMESTGGEKYDVVTCFAVLHHLLPGKRYRDILAVVTKPEWTGVRGLLINLINGILSVTKSCSWNCLSSFSVSLMEHWKQDNASVKMWLLISMGRSNRWGSGMQILRKPALYSA